MITRAVRKLVIGCLQDSSALHSPFPFIRRHDVLDCGKACDSTAASDCLEDYNLVKVASDWLILEGLPKCPTLVTPLALVGVYRFYFVFIY
jgi:hypothetical protein